MRTKRSTWESKRATFIDVGNAQWNILDLIDKCIAENRPLKKSEKEFFFENFRMATQGLTADYTFFLKGKQKTYDFINLGHMAYWLMNRESSTVDMTLEKFEIKEIWRQFRDTLIRSFPSADETSSKISKEIERKRAGVGKPIDSI